ncbi:SDR family NAD(P)-dependent oxidoreductase [Streptomyces sp. NBC_00083]|uniref:SDR family NAD(P)-dependent oxidoreductase n=1 Tax=Streptomyces sp. NBC_00083 TaxID=2975647 RepID=UPI00225B5F14|nr:SDR family oxidoreductase [Streptomyces sp. NBC_00083]MCX5386236.1 SDR family oxidoreductase [Streptomyces sp. NBC_00083]
MNDKRVVIVTGAGSGIGEAAARLLCEGGHSVVAGGRRAEPLERLAREAGALAHPCDVGTPEAADSLVRAALDTYGRIDGIVLNAGIGRGGTVGDLSLDDWDEVMRTNVTGPLLLLRAAMPHLIEARGAVVSVASVSALRNGRGNAPYAVSKSALLQLARSVAVDYAHLGVRSNIVCPSWVRTEMADRRMSRFADEAGLGDGGADSAYAEATRLLPMGRPAEPREVAEAISWLLSPASSYVNGSVLTIDGGATALDPGTLAFDFRITPREDAAL